MKQISWNWSAALQNFAGKPPVALQNVDCFLRLGLRLQLYFRTAFITYFLYVINLPPVLPSRFISVCFVVSGPQSRVPISNGSSNALLNHAVVKEGWNSMWRANRANPRRRQRNEKNLMRGTTAVPWNKITQLLIIFILMRKFFLHMGLYHTMWFSIGHFHFIIELPEAQPNYIRSFHPSTKKDKMADGPPRRHCVTYPLH